MAIRLSSGLQAEIKKSGGKSFADALANGVIDIYTGAQPLDADNAETGTKLVRITLGSGAFTPGIATNGINFDTVVSGILLKAVAEVWSGLGLADGVAGWYRFYDNDVTTGSSTTAIRYDGAIASSGSQLNMSNQNVTNGGTVTIDSAEIELPRA